MNAIGYALQSFSKSTHPLGPWVLWLGSFVSTRPCVMSCRKCSFVVLSRNVWTYCSNISKVVSFR